MTDKMKTLLKLVETVVPKKNNPLHIDPALRKYCFEIVIGNTVFSSPWFCGSPEKMEADRQIMSDAFMLSKSDIELKF